MTFIALTPTLSQREREILETVLYFPRPLGEGYRVREFGLRSHSFYEFWDSCFSAGKNLAGCLSGTTSLSAID